MTLPRSVRQGVGFILLCLCTLAVPADPLGQCGACTTSFECAEGLTCVGARCKAADTCCLDEDCPAGQGCRNHQCKITGGQAAQCGSCSTTFECSNDLRCIGARCRAEGQCCLDLDCPSGQSCQNHQCKPTGGKAPLCGSCSTSFECANDVGCVGARCKQPDQCCFDQDCASGQTCREHRCVVPGAPPPAPPPTPAPGDASE